MATERLFDQNAYTQEFAAVVLSCKKTDKGYESVLDRTAFFPEEGGQYADTGMIDKAKVLNVREKEEIIYHMLDSQLEIGQEVKGQIDFLDRFSKMQQHTGEHIVSGLVHRLFGYDNVGFHLGAVNVTMDFNGMLTEKDLRKVERMANEAVAANLDIDVSYPGEEELKALQYRSKIEIEGQVRIVTIAGYDICACCAPHVKRTGEIGMIKLTGAQKYKGGMRVSMLCGFRALRDYNQKETNVHQISAALSVKPEETAQAVERIKEELFWLKGQLMEAQEQLLRYKINELPENATHICLFESSMDGVQMRNVVNEGMKRCKGFCAVFAGNDNEGYRYVIGSENENCQELSKQLNEKLQGRGGGKPQMVQGSLKSTEAEIKMKLCW